MAWGAHYRQAEAAYEENEAGRRKRLAVGSLDTMLSALLVGANDAYYRVSDLSTLFQEITGASATTPAVVDGVVGTIKDKGPNARHLMAASNAARGLLRLSGGVYYIEADGVNTRYATGTLASNTTWAHYQAMAARRRSAATFSFGRRVSSALYALLQSGSTAVAQSVSRNTGGLGTVSAGAATWPADTFITADGISKVGSGNAAVAGGAYATSAIALTNDAAAGALQLFTGSGGTVETALADWCGGVSLNYDPASDQRATINLALTAMYNPAVLDGLKLAF